MEPQQQDERRTGRPVKVDTAKKSIDASVGT
jgi:hypothetical protein